MADGTGIQWTDASWNPLRARHGDKLGWSCVKVSDGCKNCYAQAVNRRLGTGLDYTVGDHAKVELVLNEKQLTDPLHWTRPRRIFLSSMTDIALASDEQLDRMFAVMAQTPQHTYQVLTKRPERLREYLSDPLRVTAVASLWASRVLGGPVVVNLNPGEWPLRNVWLGVSTEDQSTADERIPHLIKTPAAVRFISAEPLLGPIDLTHLHPPAWDVFDALRGGFWGDAYGREVRYETGDHARLDWVIVGGESGPRARPFDIAWARSLRDQCREAGVALFMKQLGRRPMFPLNGGNEEWHAGAQDGRWKISADSFERDAQGLRLGFKFTLADSHGGDESEWPADLQGCRAFPVTGVPA